MSLFFERRREFEEEVFLYFGRQILSHPFLQRLDGVSFLGLVHILVDVPETYRYTRYEHSLGVAH